MRPETRLVLKTGAYTTFVLLLPATTRRLPITDFCSLGLFLPRAAVKEPSLHLRAAGLQASCCGLRVPGQSQCQGSDCRLAEAGVLGIAFFLLSIFFFREFQITSDFKNASSMSSLYGWPLHSPFEEGIESPAMFSLNSNMPRGTAMRIGAQWRRRGCCDSLELLSLYGAPALDSSSHSFLSLLPRVVGRTKF